MFKKLAILVLAIFIFGVFLWGFKDRKRSTSETDGVVPSVSQEKKEYDYQWANWEDPAGFAFEYPEQVEIDNHPEDEDNYSHLTLSHSDHQGGIIIICNDSDEEDIGAWQENNEEVREVSSLETKIASVSGLKLALGEGKEMTAFIDWDEVLYTVSFEVQDQDYWQPVYKYLLDSFELIPLEGETESQFQDWLQGFDTEGADVVESVEIIQ